MLCMYLEGSGAECLGGWLGINRTPTPTSRCKAGRRSEIGYVPRGARLDSQKRLADFRSEPARTTWYLLKDDV